MFFIQCVLVLVIHILVIQALIPLPAVEENVLLKTKEVIQLTANTLLTLIIPNAFRNTKLKTYANIHNYFVSLTVLDYKHLKEITKLTRFNINCNVTSDFITVINEIIEEENNLKLNKVISFNKNIDKESNIKELSEAFFDDQSVNNNGLDSRFQNGSLNKDGGGESLDHRYWGYDSDVLDDGRRLYNGKKTKIKDFGFMASVHIFGRFQCAGSIIAKDLVITAASCLQLAHNNRFYRENPKFLSVRVGSTYSSFGGEVIDVLVINFHPSYVPATLRHNLAIMRLQRHLKFNTKFVNMIEIDANKPLKLRRVTVVGWGAKSEGSAMSPGGGRLRYAQLHPYDLRECQKVYSKQYVTHSNFCAGFVSRGSGACNKDVGGPGIVGTTLVGVISFGAPVCGTPDTPTVFEKLSHYSDWIHDIMDQDVPYSEKRTTTRQPYNMFLYETTMAGTTTWTISVITDKKATGSIDPDKKVIRGSDFDKKAIGGSTSHKKAISGTKSDKITIRGSHSEKKSIRGLDLDKTAIKDSDLYKTGSDKSCANYKCDPRFNAITSGTLDTSVESREEKITRALVSSEGRTSGAGADFAATLYTKRNKIGDFARQTKTGDSVFVPQFVNPVRIPTTKTSGPKDKEIEKLMQIVGDTVNKTALEIDAEILNLNMKGTNILRFKPREHSVRQKIVKPIHTKIEDSVPWNKSSATIPAKDATDIDKEIELLMQMIQNKVARELNNENSNIINKKKHVPKIVLRDHSNKNIENFVTKSSTTKTKKVDINLVVPKNVDLLANHKKQTTDPIDNEIQMLMQLISGNENKTDRGLDALYHWNLNYDSKSTIQSRGQTLPTTDKSNIKKMRQYLHQNPNHYINPYKYSHKTTEGYKKLTKRNEEESLEPPKLSDEYFHDISNSEKIFKKPSLSLRPYYGSTPSIRIRIIELLKYLSKEDIAAQNRRKIIEGVGLLTTTKEVPATRTWLRYENRESSR